MVLVAIGSPRWVPGWFYVITVIMAHGNSTVNVFIYGFTNRHFRAAYKRLVCCEPCRQAKQRRLGNRIGAVHGTEINFSTLGAQSRKKKNDDTETENREANNSVKFESTLA